MYAGCAGCMGGEGNGDSGDEPGSARAYKFFVSDPNNSTIVTLANTNQSTGLVRVDRSIAGSNTGLSSALLDLTYDAAHDRLYVGNGKSVLIFDSASTVGGNVSPARTFTSAQIGW